MSIIKITNRTVPPVAIAFAEHDDVRSYVRRPSIVNFVFMLFVSIVVDKPAMFCQIALMLCLLCWSNVSPHAMMVLGVGVFVGVGVGVARVYSDMIVA